MALHAFATLRLPFRPHRVRNTRVHTPSNNAGTHFSAGQRLQLRPRKTRSRFAAPLLALPSPRMKSEPLLKGQPPTSPEVFAWRTTVVGAKRHSSTAASVVIEDRTVGLAASCRILCRPSTMR